MKKTVSNSNNTASLTEEQQAELDALVEMPDGDIDTQDIPEVEDWSGAKRGAFYRPIKKQITLRIDADLIAWFQANSAKPNGKGYQTSINHALREYVEQQLAGE